MKSFLTILFLGAATAAPQFSQFKDLLKGLTGEDEPGEVNGDYEQVPYTVIQKFDDYEERVYPSVNWACTEMTYENNDEDDGEEESDSEWNVIKMMQKMMSKKSWKKRPSSKMFMKLFRYISGVNEQSEEIEMTVPVLTRMKLLENNMINKQMCFYLNKKHQENPPTPVDEDVKIEKNEEMTVYVHTFGGYAMQDSVWIKEAQAFAKTLKKNVDSIDFSDFYTAGYDSPMKFWNRRNEVMFLVNTNEI